MNRASHRRGRRGIRGTLPIAEPLETRVLLSAALVKDIYVGSSSSPFGFAATSHGTIFWAISSTISSYQLYVANGTPGNATLIKNIKPVIVSGNLSTAWKYDQHAELNGFAYFFADDGGGYRLWKSDGTAAGTTKVLDPAGTSYSINPSGGSPDPFGVGAYFGYPTRCGNAIYFCGDDGSHGAELFKTDGTAAGTGIVKDLFAGAVGSVPQNLTVANGLLFFSSGLVYRSDGTSDGTFAVSQDPAQTVALNPGLLTNGGNRLYFRGTNAQNQIRLYSSDGSPGSIAGLVPGNSTVVPNLMLGTINNKLLFYAGATSSSTTNTLRITDGTNTSAMNVSFTEDPSIWRDHAWATLANGTIFFHGYDIVGGESVYRSDGTSAGTVRVMGFGNTGPEEFKTLNGHVYFTADQAPNYTGYELWRTDGTAQGTTLIADINPGTNTSAPNRFAAANGMLFLVANDGTHGAEPWRQTDDAGPFVWGAVFRYDLPQHAAKLTFNEDLAGTLTEADVTITNTESAAPLPGGSFSVASDAAGSVTVTFPGFADGRLPDGSYRLTVARAGVADAAGNAMAADYSFEFFVLNGDANHDRTVDTLDFNALAANFGKSNATYAQADFDYDAVVDTLDFNALAAQFGKTLPVPRAGSMAAPALTAPARSWGNRTLFGDRVIAGDPRAEDAVDAIEARENGFELM